jgi:hypothetical protein
MTNYLFRFAGKLLLLVLALALTLTAQAQNGPAEKGALTPEERQAAIKYLEDTRQKVLDSIKDLSDEQWNFKSAPDRWSAAEVGEHIAVSEGTLLALVTDRVMKSAAAPEKKDAAKGTDQSFQDSGRNDQGLQRQPGQNDRVCEDHAGRPPQPFFGAPDFQRS